VVASGGLREPLAALAGLSVLGLIVGLLGRWGPVVQAGLSLAVAQYAAYLLERGDADSLAPLYAGGLLISAELAYDAIEPRGARERRAGFVVLLGVVAVVVALLALGAAAVSTGGLLVEVVGIGAAVGTLALLARLAWTARRA
jgi:hypothetical protein